MNNFMELIICYIGSMSKGLNITVSCSADGNEMLVNPTLSVAIQKDAENGVLQLVVGFVREVR